MQPCKAKTKSAQTLVGAARCGELTEAATSLPEALGGYNLELADQGRALVYSYDTSAKRTGITSLLKDLQAAGLGLKDVQTSQSSLEDIFVGLVREDA